MMRGVGGMDVNCCAESGSTSVVDMLGEDCSRFAAFCDRAK